MQSPPDKGQVETVLRQALFSGANPVGWPYYRGNASRIEPTSWALLATDGARQPDSSAIRASFLTRCQQPSGWLFEQADWPVNIAFNALTLFTWLRFPALATDTNRQRLLLALVASKGTRAPQSPGTLQDNQLQAWSWVDGTFSWVEPTCWALLALKLAASLGAQVTGIQARVDEAERLLLDRTCDIGGWNYGNAMVLNQQLRPFVPTTALGLLALYERREDPRVVKSLAFLESHWSDEPAATSLGLSLICLARYGRPVHQLERVLRGHAPDAIAFGNMAGLAIALLALSQSARERLFGR